MAAAVFRERLDEANAPQQILLIEDEPALADSVGSPSSARASGLSQPPTGSVGSSGSRRSAGPGPARPDVAQADGAGRVPDRAERVHGAGIIVVYGQGFRGGQGDGARLGADDYVTKPFSMRELVARVRATLRRAGMVAKIARSDVLSGGPVEMDVARHVTRVRGEPIDLTPKEFDLLKSFLLGLGRLRTRGHLISEVWGPDYFGDTKTLDVHVKRLRQKSRTRSRTSPTTW